MDKKKDGNTFVDRVHKNGAWQGLLVFALVYTYTFDDNWNEIKLCILPYNFVFQEKMYCYIVKNHKINFDMNFFILNFYFDDFILLSAIMMKTTFSLLSYFC